MRPKRGSEGFTLLELLVVSVLIAVMLALTVPRVQGLFFNDPLNRSTRLLVSAISQAREAALESGRARVLRVDFSAGLMTMHAQEQNLSRQQSSAATPAEVRLEEPVAFGSIWTHTDGVRQSGSTKIRINRRGMIEPSIIELRGSGRVMSLQLSPFLAEAEVFDRALRPPAAMPASASARL